MIKDFERLIENLDGDTTSDVFSEKKSVNRNDVEKYAIDLDTLEVFLPDKKGNNEDKKDKDWQNLDVRLIEIVNSFIASSERPVFLIRDDKLVYVNQAAQLFFGLDKDFVGDNFFNMVVKDDWSMLSENIGEMITDSKEIRIRIKNDSGKITSANLRAIYLPESDHFSFILYGEHKSKKSRFQYNSLHDEKTGLPTFFLFEDRVQVAVCEENFKQKDEKTSIIAIVALNIDNIDVFRKMQIDEFVICRVAETLSLSLPKNSTVAMGLKYSFWLMLKLKNKDELNEQLANILDVLSRGVSDNFIKHDLLFSMGVSLYPKNTTSSKTLMEQAIKALEKNQSDHKKAYEVFREEKL